MRSTGWPLTSTNIGNLGVLLALVRNLGVLAMVIGLLRLWAVLGIKLGRGETLCSLGGRGKCFEVGKIIHFLVDRKTIVHEENNFEIKVYSTFEIKKIFEFTKKYFFLSEKN